MMTKYVSWLWIFANLFKNSYSVEVVNGKKNIGQLKRECLFEVSGQLFEILRNALRFART